MQNPFVTTYSKIPDNSYIHTDQINDIIDNFRYEYPSEAVYKITGVRGSGKTVLLAKIEEELESIDNNWLICRISPARNMLQQLYAELSEDLTSTRSTGKRRLQSISLSASVLGTGGGVGLTASESKAIIDIGVELERLLKKAKESQKRILVGVDEISKTTDVITFVSEFGKWLRAGYPIYLVCTGLYENMEQLSNVSNLTFFRRATTVKTEPLNQIKMTEMYKNRLDIDTDKARQYAVMTKGYAYAFQELGVIRFKNHDYSDEELEESLKIELFAYAYEKIWEEMSDGDRNLVRLITDQAEYKKSDVISRMDKPGNYAVYRDRLIRRGILISRQGYIGLSLPYFGDYINEYNL